MKHPITVRLAAWLLILTLAFGNSCFQAEAAQNQNRAAEQKLVALTFDDGPCRDTLRLLDALKDRQVKATFFMLGSNAKAYPNIVKRAYEDGHQIASHTYDHSQLTQLSDEQLRSQIRRTKEALDSAIGASNTYIVRPPYGSYNQRVLNSFGAAGIYWSVDSNDWRWTNDAEKTVSEIMKYTADGDIILIHDIHTWSVDAAIRAVDRLKAQGFTFVTVSELFRRRGVALKAGNIYFNQKSTGVDLPGIASPQIRLTVSRTQSFASISADPGTVIHYTTDGTIPTANSPVYTNPIPLTAETTLTAVAGFDMNGSRSDPAVVTLQPAGTAPKPNIHVDETGLVTLDGPITMFYTTDHSYPTEQKTKYLGPFHVDPGTVIEAICFDPAGTLLASPVAQCCYSHHGHIYADVTPDDWFYDSIEFSADTGLLQGLGDNRMAPKSPLTRGMLVTMLHRLAGQPQSDKRSSFSDVPEQAWYAQAVAWAGEQGITEGYPDGTFRPNRSITREQLAVFLYRFARNELRFLAKGSPVEQFSDSSSISAFAKPSVYWAVESGIIQGLSQTELAPRKEATRAQTAAMIQRFLAWAEQEPVFFMSDAELKTLGDQVLCCIANHDTAALAHFVHPQIGLRFTPYSTVEEDQIVLYPEDLIAAGTESTIPAPTVQTPVPTVPVPESSLIWGRYDGSGEPIALSFDAYWNRFVWCADFTKADRVGLNTICHSGNSIENLAQAYPDCQFVDYTIDHYLGYEDDSDWASLKLVFQKAEGQWYLVGIIHGEWTI